MDGKPLKSRDDFIKDVYESAPSSPDAPDTNVPPPVNSAQPSETGSLMSKYYGEFTPLTPHTLDTLEKLSKEMNLQEFLESGKYSIENVPGVPLQYDAEGNLTPETYAKLQEALKTDTGSLQPGAPIDVNQQGSPALMQPAVQATEWGERVFRSVEEGSDPTWWSNVKETSAAMWEGVKEYAGDAYRELVADSKEVTTIEGRASYYDTPGCGSYGLGSGGTCVGGDRLRPGDVAVPRNSGFEPNEIFDATFCGSNGCQTYKMRAHDLCDDCNQKGVTIDVWGKEMRERISSETGYNFSRHGYAPVSIERGVSDTSYASLSQGLMQSNTLESYADWSQYRPLDLSDSIAPPQLAAGAQEFDIPGPYEPAIIAAQLEAPSLYEQFKDFVDLGDFELANSVPSQNAPSDTQVPEVLSKALNDAADEGAVDGVFEDNTYRDYLGNLHRIEPLEEISIRDSQQVGEPYSVPETEKSFYEDVVGTFNEGWQGTVDEMARLYDDAIAGLAANPETPIDLGPDIPGDQGGPPQNEGEGSLVERWGSYLKEAGQATLDALSPENLAERAAELRERFADAFNDLEYAGELTYDEWVRAVDPPADTVREQSPPTTDADDRPLWGAVADSGAPENDDEVSVPTPVREALEDAAKEGAAPESPTPVPVETPRGADCKTLSCWFESNGKDLSPVSERETDFQAAAAACGGGSYRGTVCQNNWLLNRYQEEAWADARAVAAAQSRPMDVPYSDTQFDADLMPIAPSPQDVAVDGGATPEEQGGIVPASTDDSRTQVSPDERGIVERARDAVEDFWGDVKDIAKDSWENVKDYTNDLWGDDPVTSDPDSRNPDIEFERTLDEAQKASDAELLREAGKEANISTNDITSGENWGEEEGGAAKESESEERIRAAAEQEMKEDGEATERAKEEKEAEKETKQPEPPAQTPEEKAAAEKAAQDLAKREAQAGKTKDTIDKAQKALNAAKGAQKSAKDIETAKAALNKVAPFLKEANALAKSEILTSQERAQIQKEIGKIQALSKELKWGLENPYAYATKYGWWNEAAVRNSLAVDAANQAIAASRIVSISSGAFARYVAQNATISRSILTNTPLR